MQHERIVKSIGMYLNVDSVCVNGNKVHAYISSNEDTSYWDTADLHVVMPKFPLWRRAFHKTPIPPKLSCCRLCSLKEAKKRGKVLFDNEVDATVHAKAAGLEIDHAFCTGCLEKLSQTSNVCPCCNGKFFEVYKVDSGNTQHIRVVYSVVDFREYFDSDFSQHSNKQLVIENLHKNGGAIVILLQG